MYGALGDAKTETVILSDMDRDGDLDALVGNQAGAEIWLNDGRGKFSDSGQDIAYSDRHVVTLGDVDGDCGLDVFAGALGRSCTIWRNNGAAHFDPESPRKVFHWLATGVLATIVAGLFVWWAIHHRCE